MDFTERAYIALDKESAHHALGLAEEISDAFHNFKIGPIMISQSLKSEIRVPIIRKLHQLGRKRRDDSRKRNIFIDMKLHDTPATVYRAVKELGGMEEISMLTIHVDKEEMCREAVRAVRESGNNVMVIGVTELSSSRYFLGRSEVLKKAKLALKYGLHGVVSHAAAVPMLERNFHQDLQYVATGLEFKGISGRGQQKPYPLERAVADSENSILVIGSALTKSKDPHATAYEMIRLFS